MKFERAQWSGEYSRTQLPRFSCPRCDEGRLRLAEGSLDVVETGYSKSDSGHPDWEPGWETERFSMKLVCDHDKCAEVVMVVGDTTVAEYYDEEFNSWALMSLLRPRAFFPAPPIIAIPKEVPTEVREQTEKASELFWSDLSAAANRLRVGVELLLDHFKVPRTGIDNKGKSRHLDLFDRIALFEKTDPDHARTLTALRLIGNLGSHGGGVNREALLDAYEIYEDALAELCGQRSQRIEQLRKKLIASKGKY